MGQVLSGWIDATPWMPRLHTRDEDMKFCAHLVETCDVWVVDLPSGFGFLARNGHSIDALYLADSLRRQGWGRKLLDAAREGRDRLTLWVFQANRAAVGFYQACGFQIAEETDGASNDEGLPDYRMTWERTVG